MALHKTKNTFIVLLKLYGYGLVLFFILRLVFLINNLSLLSVKSNTSLVFKAFIRGIKYDTQIILYLMLPMLALLVIQGVFFLFKKEVVTQKINVVATSLFAILFLIYTLLCIVELFYYNFFKARFNILVFGIEQDSHVVQSIQKEFPVVWLLLLALLIFGIHFYCLKKLIFNSDKYVIASNSKIKLVIIGIVLLAFYILGLRGSISTFPINETNAAFCKQPFINDLVKNPIICLQNAYLQKSTNVLNIDTTNTLKVYGFTTAGSVLDTLQKQGFNNIGTYDTTSFNAYAKNKPPNIVILQMESMSNLYLNLHAKDLNVLGALENELPYLNIFRHCTSMRNGTHSALDFLQSKCLLAGISTSEFYKHAFTTNISNVYKQLGYNTSFVTGNELGWNSLDRSLIHQHFSKVVGKTEVLQQYPQAPLHEYGVQDEAMFDYIFKALESSTKPNFIYGMTISNHSPYQIPKSYKVYPVNLKSNKILKQTTTNEQALKNVLAYQYANDCLGKFLNKLRNSKFASNTIVVFTGDHNSKSVFDFTGENYFQLNAVPIGYYIPQAYKPAIIDTSIFANQADIIPTILNLSTSKLPFANWGNNMFANVENVDKHYAINFDNYWYANANGMVDFSSKPLYYNWKDNYRTKVILSDTTIKALSNKPIFAKALFASNILYVQNDILNSKK